MTLVFVVATSAARLERDFVVHVVAAGASGADSGPRSP
jgi:hypothetical protein